VVRIARTVSSLILYVGRLLDGGAMLRHCSTPSLRYRITVFLSQLAMRAASASETSGGSAKLPDAPSGADDSMGGITAGGLTLDGMTLMA
jgi:hypothetical protein